LEFTTTNTSSQTPGLHLARVYTISTIELFIKIVALSLTHVVGGSLSVSMWTKRTPNRLCYEWANILNTDVQDMQPGLCISLSFSYPLCSRPIGQREEGARYCVMFR
jgi:hypothetical protein